MRISTLPVVEWQSFTDRFSRAHAGAIVSLKANFPGGALANEVVDQSFRGVSVDGAG